MSQNFCTDRVPPSAIDIPDNDSWIAVGDSENEWFTFRRGWGDRICKTHTEVAGFGVLKFVQLHIPIFGVDGAVDAQELQTQDAQDA